MIRRPSTFALLLSLLTPAAALGAEPSSPAQPAPQAEAPPDASVPPPPEAQPPAPPAQAEASPPIQAPPARAAPDGQWVYTAQYGWVWMPYDRGYVRAPPDGEPYMFVYGPTLGWTWVAAPWVWGWGPVPRFGVWSGVGFFWWGHGWGPGWHAWRPLAFRHGYPYRCGPGWRPGWRGGPGWHGGPGWRGGPGRGWHGGHR